ncbi:MAG: DsbA family protein [Rhodospirillaceae bacterium]|nr:DsbA family protein [Rhodospirillaceae bacterium]
MVQGAAATIEVYHDLICPWCFIGKRRFEVALSHHRGAPVVVRWQPFLLNPNMPVSTPIILAPPFMMPSRAKLKDTKATLSALFTKRTKNSTSCPPRLSSASSSFHSSTHSAASAYSPPF